MDQNTNQANQAGRVIQGQPVNGNTHPQQTGNNNQNRQNQNNNRQNQQNKQKQQNNQNR